MGWFIQLMAVDVITDSNHENVFAHKYPYQTPVHQFLKKGGIFIGISIPVTFDELCSNSYRIAEQSL